MAEQKISMHFDKSLFRNNDPIVALSDAIDLILEQINEENHANRVYVVGEPSPAVYYCEQVAVLSRLRQCLKENLERNAREQAESFQERQDRQQREFDAGRVVQRHEARLEKIDKAIANAKEHDFKNACADLQQKKEALISRFNAARSPVVGGENEGGCMFHVFRDLEEESG